MSQSASEYFATSEGEAVIISIAVIGSVFLSVIVLGFIGWWCFHKGKRSRPPKLFAKRPVWALPGKVEPTEININQPGNPQAPGQAPGVDPIAGGDIHIYHNDNPDKVPAKKVKERIVSKLEPQQNPNSVPESALEPAPIPEELAKPTIAQAVAKLPKVNQPKLSQPSYLPAISTGKPLVKGFLPLSVQAELTTPMDNVLTDYLLRFATGSQKQVPRNTNLKSVLILNKQRRKNVIDDIEGREDWDEEDEELEEQLASEHKAVGGDEIDVDARGGRVYVDGDDQLFVFADENAKKQQKHTTIL